MVFDDRANLLAGPDALACADEDRQLLPDARRPAWRLRLFVDHAQAAMSGPTVLAVSGDGGAMYTIQALWSAARHNLPIKYIVCNNRVIPAAPGEHQPVLGRAGRQRARLPDQLRPVEADPQPQMAKALGVADAGVETAADIVPAIQEMLAYQGPYLLDAVLEGNVHPELIGVRCGQ